MEANGFEPAQVMYESYDDLCIGYMDGRAEYGAVIELIGGGPCSKPRAIRATTRAAAHRP
jgi:hypothetical protein